MSTTGLARLANRLELGAWLLLGEGESQRGGRLRPSLLASAFEAVAGAVYLDLGFEAARDWILSRRRARARLGRAPWAASRAPRAVSRSIPSAGRRAPGLSPGRRVRAGPRARFRIEVSVGGEVVGRGEGPSRRIAETRRGRRARGACGGPLVAGPANAPIR